MQNYDDNIDGVLALLRETHNTTAHSNGAGRSFYRNGAIHPAKQFPKGLLTVISDDYIPPEKNWTRGAE